VASERKQPSACLSRATATRLEQTHSAPPAVGRGEGGGRHSAISTRRARRAWVRHDLRRRSRATLPSHSSGSRLGKARERHAAYSTRTFRAAFRAARNVSVARSSDTPMAPLIVRSRPPPAVAGRRKRSASGTQRARNTRSRHAIGVAHDVAARRRHSATRRTWRRRTAPNFPAVAGKGGSGARATRRRVLDSRDRGMPSAAHMAAAHCWGRAESERERHAACPPLATAARR
jgi:hypothetical protein